jgi:hypothetical protein
LKLCLPCVEHIDSIRDYAKIFQTTSFILSATSREKNQSFVFIYLTSKNDLCELSNYAN